MSKPKNKYRSGSVEIAEWTNSGQKGEHTTYTIRRSYKDKEGNWKQTPTLFDGDLPHLAVLIYAIASGNVKTYESNPKQPQKDEPTGLPF
jgi:hypothetical protein